VPRCTRKGCGREFSEDGAESCTFHPGAPVFHEGLKSWSCCSEVYKPVLDFDEFMKIPVGCTQTERHTDEAPRVEAPKPTSSTNLTMTTDTDGQEVYSSGPSTAPKQTIQNQPIEAVATAPVRAPVVEEEDDLSTPVGVGTACKHKGCSVSFVSDEVNRIGDGEGTVCTYHPSPPIFREGSKGYLCCKRRVLEFDEFLKIEGCKTGRHLFAIKDLKPETEQLTTCRIDHYQTPRQVIVSVFGKGADKELSKVTFTADTLEVDLFLPSRKRFTKTWTLYGPIEASASSFKILGTKLEIVLAKGDARSWPSIAALDAGNTNFVPQLAFSAGGGRGTVGGKEMVLDQHNKASRS